MSSDRHSNQEEPLSCTGTSKGPPSSGRALPTAASLLSPTLPYSITCACPARSCTAPPGRRSLSIMISPGTRQDSRRECAATTNASASAVVIAAPRLVPAGPWTGLSTDVDQLWIPRETDDGHALILSIPSEGVKAKAADPAANLGTPMGTGIRLAMPVWCHEAPQLLAFPDEYAALLPAISRGGQGCALSES
jgi:hypothetical protein